MKYINTAWNEDEATGERIPKEYMGQAFSAPPLGRWTRQWLNSRRPEIVEYAIQDAEANLALWKRSVAASEASDMMAPKFARMNLDAAYERLGDILRWLWE